jgi:hypothetical protein
MKKPRGYGRRLRREQERARELAFITAPLKRALSEAEHKARAAERNAKLARDELLDHRDRTGDGVVYLHEPAERPYVRVALFPRGGEVFDLRSPLAYQSVTLQTVDFRAVRKCWRDHATGTVVMWNDWEIAR